MKANKVAYVFIEDYDGGGHVWNEPKERYIDPHKIETIIKGNEAIPTHWIGSKRIVLKETHWLAWQAHNTPILPGEAAETCLNLRKANQ